MTSNITYLRAVSNVRPQKTERSYREKLSIQFRIERRILGQSAV